MWEADLVKFPYLFRFSLLWKQCCIQQYFWVKVDDLLLIDVGPIFFFFLFFRFYQKET